MTHIESRDNPRVKRVARLLSSGAARREEGLFVCEGPTMLREAAAAGADIAEIYMLPGQETLLSGIEAPCFTVKMCIRDRRWAVDDGRMAKRHPNSRDLPWEDPRLSDPP